MITEIPGVIDINMIMILGREPSEEKELKKRNKWTRLRQTFLEEHFFSFYLVLS